MSLTIAVWVIAISLLFGAAAIIVFLLNFQRDITKTLTQIEITLKTVEKNLDTLSEEARKTLKNTTGITDEAKSLVRNLNTVLSFNAIISPLSNKSETKNIFGRILNLARIGLGVFQGYNFIKQFRGSKNE
ncbi:MAG: DUF948 domain-containing protein [Candidatus Atribacteria bacterium]|nr:DUF948 domain-containing protein [Candidatus Atribacteria bacterium]